jgi:ribonuclease G
MAKNILVISCEARETRVALIEDGIIAELHLERKGMTPKGGSVGDVYLGKVTRVLPGLQAAFIDIGLERAAFLHVEDLIRPDDFETYLAGGRKHARGEEGAEAAPPTEADADEADAAAATAALEAPTGQATPVDANVEAAVPDSGDDVEETALGAHADERAEETIDATAEGDDDDDDAEDEDRPSGILPISDEPLIEDRPSIPDAAVTDPLMAAADVPSAAILDDPPSTPELPVAPRAKFDDLLDNPDLPGFTIHDPNEPAPRAPAPRADGGRGGGDRGRGRRRGRGRSGSGGSGGDRSQSRGNDRGPSRSNDGGRDRSSDRRGGSGGGRDRNGGGAPARLSKTTPIRDVVKEGQDIIVQVTKEPIGTKGARCSSHISLAGRYVVYMPTVEHVGVSKRIGSDSERARLREAIDSMKPPTGGLIVRTVAEGLTKKQLKQDVGYLVRLWGEVAKNREGAKAPHLLSSELDLVLKCARDLFTDDVEQLVIDDKGQYQRLVSFVEAFMPERLKDIVFYDEDEPIFDAYGIQDEIGRALSRKVPLPSGGYLVIDQAEALTAIDVNTGRFVGKGSKDMEETILKTNLEAVQEIAYQLRFRNIGGLIILDLIDMERSANREKVRRKLEDLLQKDKAKTSLNRISDLGLIEMTRKRTRESLGRLMNEPCFYCDGTGQLQSKETIAYEILREIRRRKADLPGYTVLINCHPAVADLLQGAEKLALQDAENRFMRKINVNPRTEYHLEQFDIVGK